MNLQRYDWNDLVSFQIVKIFKGDQYEPHAVFCFNGKYFQRKNFLEIGKMLVEGKSGYSISKELNVCAKRVAKIKGILVKDKRWKNY